MDFDPETAMLFTGDEMGYMNKWDVSRLIEKLDDLKPKEDFEPGMTEKAKLNAQKAKSAAFMT